jgi:hypothetical protein
MPEHSPTPNELFAAVCALAGDMRIELLPGYWIDQSAGLPGSLGFDVDDGTDFCLPCAENKLHAIKHELRQKPEHRGLLGKLGMSVRGGSRMEHDSVPFCRTCGAPLEFIPTEYCFDSEVEALTGRSSGPNAPRDWWWLAEILEGFRAGDKPIGDFELRPKRKRGPGTWAETAEDRAVEEHNRWLETWRAVASAVARVRNPSAAYEAAAF